MSIDANKLLASLASSSSPLNIENEDLVCGAYEGLDVDTGRGGLGIFLRTLRAHNTKCHVVVWCQRQKYIPAYTRLATKYRCVFSANKNHPKSRRLFPLMHA